MLKKIVLIAAAALGLIASPAMAADQLFEPADSFMSGTTYTYTFTVAGSQAGALNGVVWGFEPTSAGNFSSLVLDGTTTIAGSYSSAAGGWEYVLSNVALDAGSHSFSLGYTLASPGPAVGVDVLGSLVFTPAPVPEPASAALMLAGVAALGALSRRRKTSRA